MVKSNRKQFILAFIKKHKLAVISTVNKNNNPESAVIEFGQTDSLELIFDTFSSYRKYKNIQHKPRVSFVIGWDEDITVQYEGTAVELKGEKSKTYKKIFLKKHPDAKKWENFKQTRYFKVTPTWIRYSDLRKYPWDVVEVRF